MYAVDMLSWHSQCTPDTPVGRPRFDAIRAPPTTWLIALPVHVHAVTAFYFTYLLCCAVLCCTVLCCTVLCCTVLCRNVPCSAVPCSATLSAPPPPTSPTLGPIPQYDLPAALPCMCSPKKDMFRLPPWMMPCAACCSWVP